jgi:hypothetical protein
LTIGGWSLAGLVLLAGCARAAPGDLPDIAVGLMVAPSPPATGAATLTATLRDAGGAPLRGAAVSFECTMSHAGMAPVQASARETAPGRYEAPLEFTMAGEWIVIVRATLPDSRALEREIKIGNVVQREKEKRKT